MNKIVLILLVSTVLTCRSSTKSSFTLSKGLMELVDDFIESGIKNESKRIMLILNQDTSKNHRILLSTMYQVASQDACDFFFGKTRINGYDVYLFCESDKLYPTVKLNYPEKCLFKKSEIIFHIEDKTREYAYTNGDFILTTER